jgi:crotonobetainyl-CoA:carnitine CoA-transferase CaiB-like acyl-CoA transferase
VDPYAVRPSHGAIAVLDAAEKFGASTRNILRSLDYSDDEIQALLAAGAISESWSDEYLPS